MDTLKQNTLLQNFDDSDKRLTSFLQGKGGVENVFGLVK